jgi:hypothetical protein
VNCHRCGEPHAPFGIGPPLEREQRWYCGACIAFHPSSQADLARRAREALEEK